MSNTPHPRDRTPPDDPQVIDVRIAQARQRVFGGRGPDVDPRQVLQAQRDRPTLGGQPTAAERQAVADQTTLARGDPDDLRHLDARRAAAGQVAPAPTRDDRRPARTPGQTWRLLGAGTLAGAALTWAVAALRRARPNGSR